MRSAACIWNMRLMFSLLVAVGVEHAAALFEPAAVDAHVGQVAVLVVDDLERQAAERLFGIELALDDPCPGPSTSWPLIGGDVGRGGQIVDDAVEQPLHADVFQRRAAEDRVHLKSIVPLRSAARISSSVIVFGRSRYFSVR